MHLTELYGILILSLGFVSFYPPRLPIVNSIPNPNYSKLMAQAPKIKQCKNVFLSKGKRHVSVYLSTSSLLFPFHQELLYSLENLKKKDGKNPPNLPPRHLTNREVSKTLLL